jgi:hypothetical protein
MVALHRLATLDAQCKLQSTLSLLMLCNGLVIFTYSCSLLMKRKCVARGGHHDGQRYYGA